MTDIEVRREARRRKILENSEKRLQKITGIENRNGNYELEGYKSSHANNTEDLISNGDLNNTHIYSHQNLNERNNILNTSISQTHLIISDQQQHLTKNQRVSIIVGIATMLNILLMCFQDNILLNKIFLPLLCFEAIDLLYHRNNFEISGGIRNILTVLYRSAIPRSIVIVARYFTLTFIVMRDVMIYFFAFICIYFVSKVLKDILFF